MTIKDFKSSSSDNSWLACDNHDMLGSENSIRVMFCYVSMLQNVLSDKLCVMFTCRSNCLAEHNDGIVVSA